MFIGTMNTADRSIRSIDIALRRRFDVFECEPDPGILERYYDPQRGRKNEVVDLIDGMKALNDTLSKGLDRHHTIGQTFFMHEHMTKKRLRAVWKRKLKPLIEEYFFDEPDVWKAYQLEEFWPSVGED
jgi:5-methylcytosine-specific restriction protein B